MCVLEADRKCELFEVQEQLISFPAVFHLIN